MYLRKFGIINKSIKWNKDFVSLNKEVNWGKLDVPEIVFIWE